MEANAALGREPPSERGTKRMIFTTSARLARSAAHYPSFEIRVWCLWRRRRCRQRRTQPFLWTWGQPVGSTARAHFIRKASWRMPVAGDPPPQPPTAARRPHCWVTERPRLNIRSAGR